MEGTEFQAVLTDFKKPYLETVQKRDLKDGEVLIKMHAAPVHPADQGFCRGYYGERSKLKDIMGCGFEGAGEVIELGPNAKEDLLGKRVAVSHDIYSDSYQGTYRQYLYADQNEVFVYPDDVDYDLIACAFGNQ